MEVPYLTLEDFKKMLGKDIDTLSSDEIEHLYRVAVAFADMSYKKWLDKRALKEGKKY